MRMIHRDSFTTLPPSNVNLEDLGEGRPFHPKGEEEYTDASLLRTKCQLVYPTRKQCEGTEGVLDRLPRFFVERDEIHERKYGHLMVCRSFSFLAEFLSLNLFLDGTSHPRNRNREL